MDVNTALDCQGQVDMTQMGSSVLGVGPTNDGDHFNKQIDDWDSGSGSVDQ